MLNMSNTITILAINQIQVNGGSTVDPVVAINAKTCLLSEWYAALQVWFARQIATATASGLSQGTTQANAANAAAQTAQTTLATLQGHIDTLVQQGIAAGSNLPALQAVLTQASILSSPARLAAKQARLTAITAEAAKIQAEINSL